MTGTTRDSEQVKTANPPPIPGPLGTHPLGTAPGAAAGGLAGKKIADLIDPAAELAYWRENFSSRPYVRRGATFNEYRPAYSYGIHAYSRHEGRSFEEVEPQLMREWDSAKGISSLTWEGAKLATRDAWQHVSDLVERAAPERRG
jgi:hypothetical protein